MSHVYTQYTTLGADVTFTCHHGPNECYGNKVQSCAIEHIQVRIQHSLTHFNYIFDTLVLETQCIYINTPYSLTIFRIY